MSAPAGWLDCPSPPPALQSIEEVPHLVFFGAQVRLRGIAGCDNAGHSLDDLNARPLDRLDFLWIIREQPYFRQIEKSQNLAGQRVAPKVHLKAELLIGFDCIGAAILQLISSQLIEETDSPPFLMLVNQKPARLFGD